MCVAAENPQAARTPICRRAWGGSKAKKPRRPKITSESVTPSKSVSLLSINALRYAIDKIAGQFEAHQTGASSPAGQAAQAAAP
jgi:hypothetical protein